MKQVCLTCLVLVERNQVAGEIQPANLVKKVITPNDPKAHTTTKQNSAQRLFFENENETKSPQDQ